MEDVDERPSLSGSKTVSGSGWKEDEGGAKSDENGGGAVRKASDADIEPDASDAGY